MGWKPDGGQPICQFVDVPRLAMAVVGPLGQEMLADDKTAFIIDERHDLDACRDEWNEGMGSKAPFHGKTQSKAGGGHAEAGLAFADVQSSAYTRNLAGKRA